MAFRGDAATVSTFGNKPILESNCEACGECLERCPTGALMSQEHEAAGARGKNGLSLLRRGLFHLPGHPRQ